MTESVIRAYLSTPQYGAEPTPEDRAVLDAYRRELGADEHQLGETWPAFVSAVSWWNAGAPELYKGPTAASETLANLNALGGWEDDEGVDEYRHMLKQQDREERLARVLPSPEWPGKRPTRSRHAP